MSARHTVWRFDIACLGQNRYFTWKAIPLLLYKNVAVYCANDPAYRPSLDENCSQPAQSWRIMTTGRVRRRPSIKVVSIIRAASTAVSSSTLRFYRDRWMNMSLPDVHYVNGMRWSASVCSSNRWRMTWSGGRYKRRTRSGRTQCLLSELLIIGQSAFVEHVLDGLDCDVIEERT